MSAVELSAHLETLCNQRGYRDPVIEVGVMRNWTGLRYHVKVWPRMHLRQAMKRAEEFYSKQSCQHAAEVVLDRLGWRS